MDEERKENLPERRPETGGDLPATPDDVIQQMHTIQDLMRRAMKDGEHYGVIPGCGDKPTLLQPGAEKLGLLFRTRPDYMVTRGDLPGGHREYEVACRLYSMRSGQEVGQGVGACSSMESRYRYRSQDTGRPIPTGYWDTRDPAILGGPQYHPRKTAGKWTIWERVEHDNPADYYNTILKMAKKRAFVDAQKSFTAASDIFTQDVEDLHANFKAAAPSKPKADQVPEAVRQPIPTAAPETPVPGTATEPSTEDTFSVQAIGGSAYEMRGVLTDDHGFRWRPRVDGKKAKDGKAVQALTLAGLNQANAIKWADWLMAQSGSKGPIRAVVVNESNGAILDVEGF